MHGNRTFILGTSVGAIVAAAMGLLGCVSEPLAAAGAGGVDVLVRGSVDTRSAGALTLRSEDGAERWRLPLHAAAWQTRRLSLPAGRYALDYEPDTMTADGSVNGVLQPTTTTALPRWVVVAPARVTSIVVQLERYQSAISLAAMARPLDGDDDTLPLN